uniref:t-SNARE coiled-coil homology domain-containing protein n=1 Tax=Timema poppense TaxID=170557 RepID=A0A7R9DAE3_TIMPO|nr:unnamed protein product [Timema poppensis]
MSLRRHSPLCSVDPHTWRQVCSRVERTGFQTVGDPLRRLATVVCMRGPGKDRSLKEANQQNESNGEVQVSIDSEYENNELPKIAYFLQQIESIWTIINNIQNDTADIKNLYMGVCYLQIESIWTIINNIQNDTADIKNLYREILSLARPSEKLNLQVEDKTASVQRTVVSARNKLQVRQSITNEDCLRQIQKGELSVFTDNIIIETLEARVALDILRDRQEDLQRIEKSIIELRDMFSNMALLVELQGEKLDNIDYHVSQTKDYVKEGATNTRKAKELRKSYRKKKRIIIIVIIVILLVLVGILLAVYLPPALAAKAVQPSSPTATPTIT